MAERVGRADKKLLESKVVLTNLSESCVFEVVLHSLMFSPGRWRSTGRYTGIDGYETTLEGSFVVEPLPNLKWHIQIIAMTPDSDENVVWENWYASPRQGQSRIPLQIQSSIFGPTDGVVILSGDTLLWRYRIPSVAMKGTDVYRRLPDGRYIMRGTLDSSGFTGVAHYTWLFEQVA